MIVVVTTVETIVRQFEVEVPDGTTTESAYSRVDETEEHRHGWIESDFTAIEGVTEIATVEGKPLWVLNRDGADLTREP